MSAAWGPDQHEADVDAGQCRALFLAVLQRAIEDACGRVGDCTDGLAKEHAVRTARVWFNTADFYTVCSLAGVDPRWARERVVSGAKPGSATYPDRQVGGRMTKDTGGSPKRATGARNGSTEAQPGLRTVSPELEAQP